MTVVVEIIWWKADCKQVNHNNEDSKTHFDVFDKNLKWNCWETVQKAYFLPLIAVVRVFG